MKMRWNPQGPPPSALRSYASSLHPILVDQCPAAGRHPSSDHQHAFKFCKAKETQKNWRFPKSIYNSPCICSTFFAAKSFWQLPYDPPSFIQQIFPPTACEKRTYGDTIFGRVRAFFSKSFRNLYNTHPKTPVFSPSITWPHGLQMPWRREIYLFSTMNLQRVAERLVLHRATSPTSQKLHGKTMTCKRLKTGSFLRRKYVVCVGRWKWSSNGFGLFLVKKNVKPTTGS